MDDVRQTAEEFRGHFDTLHAEVSKVIVGNEAIIDAVLTALFAGGHCLLEGVPGLGKTMLVKVLSAALDLEFSRIQFTPDLMPADIIGTNMIVEDEDGNREYSFRKGPLFSNIVLADEINRATPKTQSALLEAMQERTISVARTVHVLEPPFFVLATQNPIEMEGTYPLPEAQMDRFLFKIIVPYPSHDELMTILDRTTQRDMPTTARVMDGHTVNRWQGFVREVPVAPQVMGYAVRLVMATQPATAEAPDMVRQYVRFGSSPRGAQALLLAGKVAALRDGRFNVSFEDVRNAATAALRHRVLLNLEAEADDIREDEIVKHLIATVKPEV